MILQSRGEKMQNPLCSLFSRNPGYNHCDSPGSGVFGQSEAEKSGTNNKKADTLFLGTDVVHSLFKANIFS